MAVSQYLGSIDPHRLQRRLPAYCQLGTKTHLAQLHIVTFTCQLSAHGFMNTGHIGHTFASFAHINRLPLGSAGRSLASKPAARQMRLEAARSTELATVWTVSLPRDFPKALHQAAQANNAAAVGHLSVLAARFVVGIPDSRLIVL